MKILVVGCQGMLAQDLLPRLQGAGFEAVGRGRPQLDITQETSVRQTLETIRPDMLINAAAYTAVDKAESEPDAAFAVNRSGVAYLAAACQKASIPFIHISTDYVFDGTATRPYREDDPTAPLGVYGQSKWEGEEAVRSCHAEHIIVRTSWLYGKHGTNFVKTMLRLGREREALRVVSDQYGCPTWTRDLAEALAIICKRLEQHTSTAMWGTYHFCGAGQTTWYDFAQVIFEEARNFEPLMVQKLTPIPTAEYPLPARRPTYSVLDCQKIQVSFGINSYPWRASLHDCMQSLQQS